MIYNNITELIGNTPLLKLDKEKTGLKNIEVYAKLEYYNPFGSVKDRIAWAMIKDDIDSIKGNKQTILESSSGNTAKALQALANIFGVPFKTVTNRIKIEEVKNTLQILGAEIEELPGQSECPDPDDPNDALAIIEREITEHPGKYFHTSQYDNQKNIEAHYFCTGTEILNDLPKVDFFFATVGTSGSSQGAALKIAEHNPDLITVGITGSTSDFIPGIRNRDELREVGLYNPNMYKKMVAIDSYQAILSMRKLVQDFGILAGPTSGACYAGTLEYLKKLDKKVAKPMVAVFIVCDRMESYTSYIKARVPEWFGVANNNKVCALSDEQVDAVPEIGISEVQKWIDAEKPVIIDTRGAIAYKISHIPGAVNIPDTHLETLLYEAEPFDKKKPLLFVCSIGRRSRALAAHAILHGYEAYSLELGITGWKSARLPLEQIKI